jgi:nicotinate-nucleotide adenylyltransferase
MKQQKKVGLLGCTFDPIHKGHLHLASTIRKKWGLDEIWFVPVQLNPHKQGSHPVSAEHRLRMVELAIKEHPEFKLEPIECLREGPSYTIETVSELHRRHPGVKFYLIIGEDALRSLMQWKEIHSILDLVTLIVGSRKTDFQLPSNQLDSRVCAAIKQGFTPFDSLDISATEIRKSLREGTECSSLLPAEVLDYIRQNMLYSQ